MRAIKSKDLASLMGVTPEALSRIKARVRANGETLPDLEELSTG